MSEERVVVRQVAWEEIFPWLCLLRAFRIALDPRKMLLATLGVSLVWASWMAISKMPGLGYDFWENFTGYGWLVGPDFIKQIFRVEPTNGLLDVLACLLGLLMTVAVWAFFGAAICRLAVIQWSLGERMPLWPALRFAAWNWTVTAGAILFPLVGVTLAALAGALIGLLLWTDVTLVIAGIVWPLALLLGIVVTLLVVGLAVGFPLIVAAVSAEVSDRFEAISRAYSYVYSRPLRYLLYTMFAVALGWLGFQLVCLLGYLVVHFAAWTASWGASNENAYPFDPNVSQFVFHDEDLWPTWFEVKLVTQGVTEPTVQRPMGEIGSVGATMIGFWISLVKLVCVSFLASYFWTAASAIYLLLRRDVDGMEMDDIQLDDAAPEFGLPTVGKDDRGVAVHVE